MRTTRRRFLWSALAGAGTLVGASAVGTHEANHPQLEQLDIFFIKLPDAFDGFKIAQLSDFHYDAYFSHTPIEAAVRTVNQLRPDLVVLTGDYVTAPVFGGSHRSSNVPEADPCAAVLAALRAPSGVYGVLGNHDEYFNPGRIIDPLQSAGIRILRNNSVAIERQGSRLWLVGLNDVIAGAPDLDKAVRGIPPGEITSLFCHEPDFADVAKKYPVDLQLSGHSHGGQIVLPVLGAPYLPVLARKYPRGLHRLGRLTLYTNRGIGTIRLPVRVHCPPEITLLTLRCGTPHSGAAVPTFHGLNAN